MPAKKRLQKQLTKKKQQRTVTTQESRPQPKKPELPKPTFQELMEEIGRAAEAEAQKRQLPKGERTGP